MNFKEYTNEAITPIADDIIKNCSQFLKGLSSAGKMYRGLKSNKGQINLMVPRSDRTPRDTEERVHDYYNLAFEKAYGVKDIRSRAVFCTGNYGDANYFANSNFVYEVFPVDGYSYWWSKGIPDLTMTVQQLDLVTPEILYNFIKLPTNGYINTNLEEALDTGNEIMLLCKEYYVVHYEAHDILKYIGRKFW